MKQTLKQRTQTLKSFITDPKPVHFNVLPIILIMLSGARAKAGGTTY
jgi:hypothetical protein